MASLNWGTTPRVRTSCNGHIRHSRGDEKSGECDLLHTPFDRRRDIGAARLEDARYSMLR
jgi:hypothetical protein